MAESLINTKRRIQTIQSTMKITKAMKLVASVKYQKWKKYYDDSFFYSSNMQDIFYTSLKGCSFSMVKNSPFYKENEYGKNNIYIFVTSSLGLCGAYNYNLYKELEKNIKDNDMVFFIGNKGLSHFKSKNIIYNTDFIDLMSSFSYSKVRRLRHILVQKYLSGEYKSINIVYTKYKNSITFYPTIEKLVPFDKDLVQSKMESVDFEPLYEPNINDVISTLSAHYVDSLIYSKLIESELSEVASRRNAMEAASDNADKMIKQLKIDYNKTRQNAITQEITEVVSGANSSKKDRR